MSDLKEEELKERDQIGVTPAFLDNQACFDKNWVLHLNQEEQINYFICLVCKQVVNNPVEINCPQHEDTDEILIAGENCLKQLLINNNNTCPIQSHDGCQYSIIRSVRQLINDITVMCPRQFQRDLRQFKYVTMTCNFKGKIKDLSDHLNNSCSLKLSECWFQQFGCDHSCLERELEKHLISNMKQHFDLVMKNFVFMQQTIQQLQEKVCQLQLENSMLKPNIEANEKKDILNIPSENVALKQQQDIPKSDDEHKTILTGLETLKQVKDNETEKQRIIDDEKKEDDNNYIYSTTNFNMFCPPSKLVNTFIGHTHDVNSIDYSASGDLQLICSGSDDETVRVWNATTKKQVNLLKGHLKSVSCVRFSQYHYHNHRSHIICSASKDKTIRFWDFTHNKQLQVFKKHTHWITGIEFSSFSSGRYLCSGSGDKEVRLWDVETFKSLHVFKGHANAVWCVDISPLQSNSDNNNTIGVIGGSGYTICSGSEDIFIWDVETTKQLTSFKGHNKYVSCVKYGSNKLGNIGCANTILSGSADKSVRLWDTRSNQQIQVFDGHTSIVTCVEYSPFVLMNSSEIADSSNVICSGSCDTTICFWDIRSNKNKLREIKTKKKE
ncbi:hypothetical protein RFI_13203 [Reticulomyxa filosa]|uniref:Uncharacterized protein n=1 Tax=Reticulomyxa filosa TaxID=46433 RepID=X6NF46_RETFI|nr:hypothetical protein RFI_13203 [Reticulomyxa filosa]|eukprot:ETO23957.1 hypothetical protein RFI_13203 [Reticulomyxa filosa]